MQREGSFASLRMREGSFLITDANQVCIARHNYIIMDDDDDCSTSTYMYPFAFCLQESGLRGRDVVSHHRTVLVPTLRAAFTARTCIFVSPRAWALPCRVVTSKAPL